MEVHIPKDTRNRGVYFDLELTPAEGRFYPPAHDAAIVDITERQKLLSFAYRWDGDNEKTYYLDLRDAPSHRVSRLDDRDLVWQLHKLWQAASWGCAYNNNRFDLKHVKALLAVHKLNPHNVRSLDPLLMVKKEFALPRYSLDYVCQHFGLKPKMHIPLLGHTLAIMDAKNDRQVKDKWADIKKYNIQDVDALEDVHRFVRPYATTHLNMAMYTDDVNACPRCGKSDTLIRNGQRYSMTNAQYYQEWHCVKKKGGCGHYPRLRRASPMTKTTFV